LTNCHFYGIINYTKREEKRKMIINDTRRPPATVEFGSLTAGQCFIDEEKFYMVLAVKPIADYNAVNLEDGRPYYFYPDQEVIKINAQLEVF
jgi:hypothetical protein